MCILQLSAYSSVYRALSRHARCLEIAAAMSVTHTSHTHHVYGVRAMKIIRPTLEMTLGVGRTIAFKIAEASGHGDPRSR